VAVAAVEAELIDVDLVGERDWLRRLVADRESLGRGVISKGEGYACRCGTSANGDFDG
jgi:hypothetical protein